MRIDEALSTLRNIAFRLCASGCHWRSERITESADAIEAAMRDRDAEIERLREALREIDNLICWEINPSNYDHDDVCRMNAEWCEIGDVARAALAGKPRD